MVKIDVKVKASRRYSEEFVRELEKSVKDIVEGRVRSYEELLEEYGVKPKKVAKT